MEVLKVCTICKLKKSLIEFCKDKRSKSGHRSSCKICSNIINKEWRQKYSQIANKETKDKKFVVVVRKKGISKNIQKTGMLKTGLRVNARYAKINIITCIIKPDGNMTRSLNY